MTETMPVQPVFDPEHIGESLRAMRQGLPIRRPDLDGIFTSDEASRRKGDGIEINGIRDYIPGDDPRHIDWAATARQPEGTLQIREHHRDIAPNFWVVTDVLQSKYGTNPGYFSEQVLGLSGLFRLMATADAAGMPAGIIAATDTQVATLAEPARGRPALVAAAKKVVKNMPDLDADRTHLLKRKRGFEIERPRLAGLLQYAAKHCSEGVVVVVSDFRDTAPDAGGANWGKALSGLGRNNDVTAIELTNPSDYRLPEHSSRFATEEGVVCLSWGKKGRQQREQYAAAALDHQVKIANAIRSSKSRHVTLSADEPRWADSLRAQLKNKH